MIRDSVMYYPESLSIYKDNLKLMRYAAGFLYAETGIEIECEPKIFKEFDNSTLDFIKALGVSYKEYESKMLPLRKDKFRFRNRWEYENYPNPINENFLYNMLIEKNNFIFCYKSFYNKTKMLHLKRLDNQEFKMRLPKNIDGLILLYKSIDYVQKNYYFNSKSGTHYHVYLKDIFFHLFKTNNGIVYTCFIDWLKVVLSQLNNFIKFDSYHPTLKTLFNDMHLSDFKEVYPGPAHLAYIPYEFFGSTKHAQMKLENFPEGIKNAISEIREQSLQLLKKRFSNMGLSFDEIQPIFNNALEYIENNWEFKGDYNCKTVSYNLKAAWISLREFGTFEFRVGNMSFNYTHHLKKILDCQKISTYLVFQLFKIFLKSNYYHFKKDYYNKIRYIEKNKIYLTRLN